MKNKFLKMSVLILALIMVIPVLTGCPNHIPGFDSTKTQLYIYNYDGGIGTEWL